MLACQLCHLIQQGTSLEQSPLAMYALTQSTPHYITLDVQTVALPAAGHTSWTTSGMAYLSFWAAGKLRCFNGGGHPWRLVVSGAPTGLAAWVGFTRLQASWDGPGPNRLLLVAHRCLAPSYADGITLSDNQRPQLFLIGPSHGLTCHNVRPVLLQAALACQSAMLCLCAGLLASLAGAPLQYSAANLSCSEPA